ncbi:MAG: hypothetical protein DVB27_00235 [Verrucomicrobia bacterium]|nr:MAG: hypothetical protein DVB27_00235 [Verrucomicrobiota bacterium]
MRLYSNENFPLPVVEELRRLGCDVTTVLETEHAGQAWPDDEVLRYASSENRVLLTLNRKDFFRLHRAQPGHGGIVRLHHGHRLSRPRLFPAARARAVEKAIRHGPLPADEAELRR